MALDYDYISSYTKNTYIPGLIDEVLGSNPSIFRALGKAKKKRWGKKIIVSPLLHSASTRGGSYGKWDTMNTDFEDKVTAAEFEPKYYRWPITISGIDKLENSGNEAEVVDILDSETQIAKMSAQDDLGADLFEDGTTSANDLDGYGAAIDDGTVVATYGGIARGTYTWWASQYDYNSGTDRALTIKLMQNMWGLCKVGRDSTDAPTYIVTTQDLWDKFASILDVSRRRSDDYMGKAGFDNLLFNGVPVVIDSHCTAGYMYFINERHTYMIVHPDENWKFVPFAEKVDQEVAIAKLKIACQMVSDECRKSGVIYSLDADL